MNYFYIELLNEPITELLHPNDWDYFQIDLLNEPITELLHPNDRDYFHRQFDVLSNEGTLPQHGITGDKASTKTPGG